MVLSLIIIQFWFDLLPPYPKVLIGAQRGYSVFSFCIIYLLGRYLKLYGLPGIFKKNSLYIYILFSVLLGCIAFIFQLTGHGGFVRIVFAYNNPIVIVSSVAFFVFFDRMSFHSNLINHIAKSTLACLLGHTAIFFLYTRHFKFLYDNYTGIEVIAYWGLSILFVFCASIVIDQIRQLLYKPIENLMKTKIKNNTIFVLPNR